MKTTPECPPKIDIHQKTQNIQRLNSERRYRVRVGIGIQNIGEAAARIQSPPDRFNINMEI